MKIAVVYWSGTGNTEAMANAVADGAKDAGADVQVFPADAFSSDKLSEFDAAAFGCPSMGAEELEPDVFEPLFESCKPLLSGKKIALFGSYGWGDGEWMRNWVDQMKNAGAEVLGGEDAICVEAPDGEAEEKCMQLGRELASS